LKTRLKLKVKSLKARERLPVSRGCARVGTINGMSGSGLRFNFELLTFNSGFFL
jgi:hypothetical protein